MEYRYFKVLNFFSFINQLHKAFSLQIYDWISNFTNLKKKLLQKFTQTFPTWKTKTTQEEVLAINSKNPIWSLQNQNAKNTHQMAWIKYKKVVFWDLKVIFSFTLWLVKKCWRFWIIYEHRDLDFPLHFWVSNANFFQTQKHKMEINQWQLFFFIFLIYKLVV